MRTTRTEGGKVDFEEERERTVAVKEWDSRARRTEGPRLPPPPMTRTLWMDILLEDVSRSGSSVILELERAEQ